MVALVSGCSTAPELKRLRSERAVLTAELNVEREKTERLSKEKQTLEALVAHLKTVRESLSREKSARSLETARVRREVRGFVEGQVKTLRAFAVEHDMLDYVGGELIARSKVGGKDQVLVDMGHALKAPATFVAGRARLTAPGTVSFCLLRPMGKELVVLWVSKSFKVAGGMLHAPFDAPIAAEKGDVPGVVCPGAVTIPYDVGTGDTRMGAGGVKAGSRLKLSNLSGKDRRAYSFGFIGFAE
jgi:outer membrane murein-binding lipoprotein Lpp